MFRTNYVTFSEVENTEKIRRSFGLWFQAEREKTGITQEALADEIDLNVKSVSRIERGESGTKRITLLKLVEGVNKLSHGYKINLDTALAKYGYGSENQIILSDSQKELFDLFSNLPPHQQEMMKTLMRDLNNKPEIGTLIKPNLPEDVVLPNKKAA
jgi:transcriptional regulator with XRE-family HTH domain